MSDVFRLDGDVAVVIGGAGSIGSAIALRLAQQGAKVVVASRNLPHLEEIVKKIESETKSEAAAMQVDVIDEQSIAALTRQVVSRFGKVDILITAQAHNVKGMAHEFPVDDWDRIYDISVRGVMLSCREFGKFMIEKKKGRIINISSVRGTIATKAGGNLGYCSSKAAVDMMSKTLAAEWAPYNITVNVVAPPVVMSEFVRKGDPERVAKNIANIPMGRLCTPEEVANVCAFLASPAADFVTGLILYVDGGLTSVG